MSFKKEVLNSLTEIKIEIAKNTTVLNEHHVRASQIESRIKPIENHVLLINSITKIFIALVGAGAAICSILHYIVKWL